MTGRFRHDSAENEKLRKNQVKAQKTQEKKVATISALLLPIAPEEATSFTAQTTGFFTLLRDSVYSSIIFFFRPSSPSPTRVRLFRLKTPTCFLAN